MDVKRTESVLKYALAVAAQAGSELGPIHLVKYAYLADLAHAEAHRGETYTGARWQFLHFGPWSADVQDQIPEAMAAIGAEAYRFDMEGEERVRYRLPQFNDSILTPLERELPIEVARSLKRAVHHFRRETNRLLHFVYTTKPMLRAAPGEELNFDSGEQLTRSAEVEAPITPEASRREERERVRKLKEIREEAQLRSKRRLEESRSARRTSEIAEPRYDDVFTEGLKWLEQLAGIRAEPTEGIAEFSDEIWKSSARRGDEVP